MLRINVSAFLFIPFEKRLVGWCQGWHLQKLGFPKANIHLAVLGETHMGEGGQPWFMEAGVPANPAIVNAFKNYKAALQGSPKYKGAQAATKVCQM
jgi:hypothetical protein